MFNIREVDEVTFIFSHMQGIRTAAVGVFVKVGSRFEKKSLRGIAHFLEHMVFKGSKHYSHKEIKREIEGRGGILNGFTSQETTAYYSQFLKNNINRTLDILLDMVIHPMMKTKEVDKERKVVKEEIEMYNDLPHLRVNSLLDKLLWENHPLGEEIIGNSNTIANIKITDLENYFLRYYRPSNFVIVCVGDVDQEDLINQVREKFKKSPRKKILLSSPPPQRLKKQKIIIEQKDFDQTHLCLGFRAPSYQSRERITMDLIHIVLGANMSSRLFEQVRERQGLCYDISSEVRRYNDSGGFIIHAGLNSKNMVKIVRSIAIELEKIKMRCISQKELGRAKDYLLGQIIMGLEKPQGRMFYLADSFLALCEIESVNKLEKSIKDISPERIRRVSRNIFNFKNACFSCITNTKEDMNKQITSLLEKY